MIDIKDRKQCFMAITLYCDHSMLESLQLIYSYGLVRQYWPKFFSQVEQIYAYKNLLACLLNPIQGV